MANLIDVTAEVEFLYQEDELSLLKCVCGKEFPRWYFMLSGTGCQCKFCGRELAYEVAVRVFEVRR